MAGLIDRYNQNSIVNSMGKLIKKISSLGLVFDDEIIKQSKAISELEASTQNYSTIDKDLLYALKSADTGSQKYIAHFDRDYNARKDTLRTFATNGEIEMILDTIADESIIYDNQNYFCKPDLSMLIPYLKKDDPNVQTILDKVNINFKKIYNYYHFSDNVNGWQLFKDWLIDGFLAFEIIYNKAQTQIIGFQKLDPASLRPDVKKIDGSYKNVWIQYEEMPDFTRILLDAQIIYISYNKGNANGKVSYLERMIRSFNLMRLMENTRIVWNLMNATFRLKMIVPIGGQSRKDAQESLNELKNLYKEDIYFDYDSGEMMVNGKPSMQFYKNYMIPSKNGDSTEIETLSGDGPELQDVEIIEYFRRKMRIESNIPSSRFEDGNSDGYENDSSSGVARDEVRFNRFLTRLRSIFQELLIKPLYIQMVLDFPELKDDFLFKENIGLEFNTNNIFEELKQMDIIQKKIEFITSLKEFGADTEGVFSTTYLLKK
jgi:hypothetical protein